MATTHSNRRATDPVLIESTATGGRDGYTLVELLLVVGILGVLASAAWLAVGGMSTEAADTGCTTDERMLTAAVHLYLAEHDEIAPTGTDHDRYERTLVAAELIRGASGLHDVTADGTIVPEGSSC